MRKQTKLLIKERPSSEIAARGKVVEQQVAASGHCKLHEKFNGDTIHRQQVGKSQLMDFQAIHLWFWWQFHRRGFASMDKYGLQFIVFKRESTQELVVLVIRLAATKLNQMRGKHLVAS